MATFRKKRSRQYKRRNTRRNRRSKKSLLSGGTWFRLGPRSSKPAPLSEPAPSIKPDPLSNTAGSPMTVGDDPLATITTSNIPTVNASIRNFTDGIYNALEQIGNNIKNNKDKLNILMIIKNHLESLENIKNNLEKYYPTIASELYSLFQEYEDRILSIIFINTHEETLRNIGILQVKIIDKIGRV